MRCSNFVITRGHLEEIFLLSNSEKTLWSNKFLKWKIQTIDVKKMTC
jgi:hypothetical protein